MNKTKIAVNYYGTVCYVNPGLDKYGNLRLTLEDTMGCKINELLETCDYPNSCWYHAVARTERDYSFLRSIGAISSFDPDCNNMTLVPEEFLRQFKFYEQAKIYHREKDEYFKSLPVDDAYEYGIFDTFDYEIYSPKFVCVYEPNEENPCMFTPYDDKWFVYMNEDMYHCKYERPLITEPEDLNAYMNELFRQCNLECPNHYYGYSMSIGDVIVFNSKKSLRAFYVDTRGNFVPVTDFWNKNYYTEKVFNILSGLAPKEKNVLKAV